MSLEEVAAHLGLSKETVHRWLRKRGLSAHKVCRLWKFKVSEANDWVRAGSAEEEQ